ncbi:MAG TPA: hypothetical protein VJM31_15385 [Vicinamibacterales bacterium]|nr:hypothetical protein [Vicinamibacterales bacterium]
MRRVISAIVMVAILVPGIALGAQHTDPGQRSREYWFAYASKLPIGSTVRVRTADGKRQTAVLAMVDAEGITLEPKARVPEPPRRVPFEQLQQLELKQNGSNVGKTIAIGAGIGAATFFAIVLAFAAALD